MAVPVASMRDSRLSFRARGVLFLLLSYDNETLISTAELPMHGAEGRDAVRTALAELRTFGYVTQTRYSYVNNIGRTQWAVETVVSDVPLLGPDNTSPVVSIEPENPLPVTDVVTTQPTRRLKLRDTPKISTTTEVTEDGNSGSLSCTTITTSSESVSRGTSYLPSAPSARPISEGWDVVPEGRPKRKIKAAKARAEVDATDPFAADLVGDDMPDGFGTMPVGPDDLDARRQRILTQRAKRPVGPSAALGDYFAMEATEASPEEPAARFNAAAMAKNFAAWRRDGVSDRHIRDMVDEYWHGSYRRNLSAPAWRDFLASQDKIHAQLERRFKAEEVEANRHNPGYWT